MPAFVLLQTQRFLVSEIRSAAEKLSDFRPVHAHEMDRAIVRIRGGMAQRRAQEGLEFRGRHLAAAHRKITVLDGAEPRDMAGDRNVPRRIRKNHLGPIVSEKPGVALAPIVTPQRGKDRSPRRSVALCRRARCTLHAQQMLNEISLFLSVMMKTDIRLVQYGRVWTQMPMQQLPEA
jgi:hypothetical protein